jgi:hypothetical protein
MMSTQYLTPLYDSEEPDQLSLRRCVSSRQGRMHVR